MTHSRFSKHARGNLTSIHVCFFPPKLSLSFCFSLRPEVQSRVSLYVHICIYIHLHIYLHVFSTYNPHPLKKKLFSIYYFHVNLINKKARAKVGEMTELTPPSNPTPVQLQAQRVKIVIKTRNRLKLAGLCLNN